MSTEQLTAEIRRRRQEAEHALQQATRLGDIEPAWDLVERAARLEHEAAVLEAQLEEPGYEKKPPGSTGGGERNGHEKRTTPTGAPQSP